MTTVAAQSSFSEFLGICIVKEGIPYFSMFRKAESSSKNKVTKYPVE